MGKAKKTIKVLFGKNATQTYWGRRGCSHGMYNTYSFNYFIYGVKGIICIEIKEEY